LDRVNKPLIQISDERLEAPELQADMDLAAFIEINVAEGIDAAKKGLIIRASLLESDRRSKAFRYSEAGLKKPETDQAFPGNKIFYN
jgi:hypothetical protein